MTGKKGKYLKYMSFGSFLLMRSISVLKNIFLHLIVGTLQRMTVCDLVHSVYASDVC